MKTGKCRYGDKCKYSHDSPNAAPATPKKNKSNGVCIFFLKGACKKGKECNYQHPSDVVTPAAAKQSGGRSSKSKRQSSSSSRSSSSSKSSSSGKKKRHSKEKEKDKGKKKKGKDAHAAVAMLLRDMESEHAAVAMIPSDTELSSDEPRAPQTGRRATRRMSTRQRNLKRSHSNDALLSDSEDMPLVVIAQDNDDFELYAQAASISTTSESHTGNIRWGKTDVIKINIDVPSGKFWRKVVRRIRTPGYRHSRTRNTSLCRSSRSAVEEARRLSIEVGTYHSDDSDHSVPGLTDTDSDNSEFCASSKRQDDNSSYPELLLADTGAAQHLVSRRKLSKRILRKKKPLPQAMRLTTANGTVEITDSVPIPIRPFGESIDAAVLPDTPAVISVGERCENGYGFYWPAGQTPFFLLPGEDSKGGRKIIPLAVHRRVPMIDSRSVARKVTKGYLRRRLNLAIDGDSSSSSQSEYCSSN
jgi:hypothetical protein